jgi:nucleoside-diphosphate-sugar epimerase
MTILELALLIKELTRTSSDITCQDLPQDDPKRRKPDITTANQQLLWTPQIELKDGLQQTIEYFKTKL